ncbi:alanine--tRNA ligase [Congzhengia minquanensis]|uniref:Alanine--tRNA ligase n=1 Tax=Congzhengia minquanensis TaxID=2763657 RepID=A0A926DNP5_9FIRM|nr:alanine--tRNA ligase [Congzhengia minquanensis]MBC8540554.1 alanine--tRNA ligase [Congzhengia minquanensis]
MEKLGLNEIREKYLSFFESKGHLRLPSFSLVPENDPSLLLINAGMAPLKPYFTGRQVPPKKRVTTCQKCIRTPDIERVGKTARHGTFFEMLGNFSFGDYFKNDATKWAWEFVTKVLNMPVDKLWVTIYEDDDEAFDIWTKNVGVSPDRIVRMGKEDNFWEIGTGPCGPCSEIYFDRGPEHGCGSPDCKVGCECDRYVEFWNLVFTQFEKQEDGTYKKLDHPNIDTGMGLERIACIMQGVLSLFDVDTIKSIRDKVCEMAGVEYGKDPQTDVSVRVVTDHIRSTVFLISDGVNVSNEGRGYVLRRLLRRAARHGKLLGINGTFLYKLADTVIDASEKAYPVLEENREMIKSKIKNEEERFAQTIDAGFSILNSFLDDKLLDNMEKNTIFSGNDAFKLYDTYGFPIDLTREILAERGIEIDEEGFNREMEAQRQRARANAKMTEVGWEDTIADALSNVAPTDFVGYDSLESEAKIIAIVTDAGSAKALAEGNSGILVLDKTPFYAESGGQVGDVGKVCGEFTEAVVTDTKKTPDGKFYHIVEVKEGTFGVGETVTAKVDIRTRRRTQANHSATHLLDSALKNKFGRAVSQAGSLVNKDRLRFDFTLDRPVSNEELAEIEADVNRQIAMAVPVVWETMPIDEAKNKGAVAVFGDKYGDVVRVVTMGNYSMELCGGCHVGNTSEIGLFKILSETGVAAGVRRIEAVTGFGVLTEVYAMQEVLNTTAEALKCAPKDLAKKAAIVMDELKKAEAKIEGLNAKLAKSSEGDILNSAREINGITVVCGRIDGATVDALRKIGDDFKAQTPCGVIVLASSDGGKATFIAMATKEAIAKGAHSGNIVREAAKIAGGGGGGRPDSAQAGGKDVSKIDNALAAVYKMMEELN